MSNLPNREINGKTINFRYKKKSGNFGSVAALSTKINFGKSLWDTSLFTFLNHVILLPFYAFCIVKKCSNQILNSTISQCFHHLRVAGIVWHREQASFCCFSWKSKKKKKNWWKFKKKINAFLLGKLLWGQSDQKRKSSKKIKILHLV